MPLVFGVRPIRRMFEDGNVCVTGLRGRGKDMITGNVTVRRGLPYSSNVDYGGQRFPFEPEKLDVGKNTFKNFISGDLNYYKFPYPDGTDIIVSDAGIYFPSQYCSELNKLYPFMPVYQASSRHLGLSNFHVTIQNLNRLWDKIREQCDTYLLCLGCHVICGFVFQKIRYYDKYDSCVSRVKPFKVNMPLIGSGNTRYQVRLARASYEASHGEIKDYYLIYKNKSDYDTRFIREILLNGKGADLN